MLRITAVTLGALVIAVTALSLLRYKAWWIRIWDFPRLQLAVVGGIAFGAGWFAPPRMEGWPRWLFFGALALAVGYQAALIWRYSPLAPVEVQRSQGGDSASRLSVAVFNVLQTNRDAERLIGVLRAADPDVVLCVETDDWWREQLEPLRTSHPHTVERPQSNTYGMLLFSRLPLYDTAIDFLIQPDVPSIQARIELRGGQRVWFNGVHPRPPAPGQSDESLERDAELLVVGKRVCRSSLPVVVCGDLNDVAWSRTTRLFQKISRLVEPRKGRGLFNTFHASIPVLRFPLDHIFHSDDFRLVDMRRLAYVGSDHFPVYAMLSFEPPAEGEQEAPAADADDVREAGTTISEGKTGARG